jgi:photosystem II stability/assembly factor-like uncharacterized protein
VTSAHLPCCFRVLAFLASLPLTANAAPAAAKPPRARAVDFEERIIFRSPENPGFAAWAQLWADPTGGDTNDLGAKLLLRRKPAPGEKVVHPPIDVHRWEAVALPVKYDFAELVNESVYLRSRDAGATWTQTLRCPEPELNQSADSGCMSPIALPDGRMLSLSWGMPGCLRESSDGGRTWRRLHELMDPAFYDVAPFTIRLLSDQKTLVIFCPYARSWGPGKLVGGRLHSQPGSRAAWQAALFFSNDFGRTLTGPIPIFPNVPVTEADFCELPSGDLLFVQNEMFANGHAHRQLIRKTKSAWVPEGMEEVAKLAPEIFVRTDEGYLVGVSRNAPYVWSEDDGVTWQAVEDIKSGEYQPRALRLKDNRILFLWHKGGDLPYGQADMYIGQHTFKLQVIEPRPRSQLKLARAFDEKARKYICAFDATLTSGYGKPIADKPIEFSIVARGAPGYEEFGGATPWVHGAKQTIKTDANGLARVSYPEQSAITDIHQTFQVAARFDPQHDDPAYLPSTSLTIEYYAVTPTGEAK